MATVNLADAAVTVDTTKDSVIIVDNFQSIRGGRTLDVTGYGNEVNDGINVFGAITAGTTYVNGTYTDVPLTGGTGSGATADITVAGTVVTAVTKKLPGTNYTAADSLSASNANIGGTGSGFAVVVTSVADTEPDLVIRAGHVIIKETATGEYKPMPVTGPAYAALPGGHTYVGILISSILKNKPMAGILVRGTVNPSAVYYPYTPILAALKTATENRIDFRAD